jgi:hypothetical protein
MVGENKPKGDIQLPLDRRPWQGHPSRRIGVGSGEALMAWMIEGSPQDVVEVPEGTPGSIPGPAPRLVPEYMAWLSSSLATYEALAKIVVRHRAEK